MNEQADISSEINPSDIIFECPECGKSLAIDERGAGYIITCPDCKSEIQVPGLEDIEQHSDIDGSESRVELSETLRAFNERIQELQRVVEHDRQKFKRISADVVLIQAALDRIMGEVEEDV